MVANRNAGGKLDKFSLGEEIVRWSQSKEKALNVVSLPYNSSAVFVQVILSYCRNRKRVLYITAEDEKNIDILNCLKKYSSFREYSYIRSSGNYADAALMIADFRHALDLDIKFDLVIYDELKSLPMHHNYEIADLAIKCVKPEGKIIVYCIDDIFRKSREMIIPAADHGYPIIEPRIITTRVDIRKDIPFVIYDFLNWSINSNKDVYIFVPDSDKAISVTGYLLEYKKDLGKSIVCFTLRENSKQMFTNTLKGRKSIIVIPVEEAAGINIVNADIMVYFADDKNFDYKKLVHFCASAGRGEAFNRGEVIFLSNEETQDMEKAKNITRNFNKEAWELGLLNI